MLLGQFEGLEDFAIGFNDLREPVRGVCILGVECRGCVWDG